MLTVWIRLKRETFILSEMYSVMLIYCMLWPGLTVGVSRSPSFSTHSLDNLLNNFSRLLRIIVITISVGARTSLWIGELGRLLQGEMHGAFEALKVPGDTYKSLKKKLLKWRTDTREVLENKTKHRFTKARIQAGESLRLYAARLEKAFRLAYPNRGVERSKTLR